MHPMLSRWKGPITAIGSLLLGALWLFNFQTPLPQIVYQALGLTFLVFGGYSLLTMKRRL